jgi:catechol 2,3-dioxygenase-like lactoylglutathione lyase family enzyme
MIDAELNHVNVTVPAALEEAAKHFYSVVLGLQQIPNPAGPNQNRGAWYQLGSAQLHLSLEDGVQNKASKRHVCYSVGDIGTAETHFRTAGLEIIPDDNASRFFLRDPGGNLIEIAERR